MPTEGEIKLWLWQYTDVFGRRRVSRWRMTEEDAKHYKDAVKVPHSLEIRTRTSQSTSDFMRSPPKS